MDVDVTKLVEVSCSSHHETLMSGLWYYLTDNHRVDSHLQAGGQKAAVHQLVADVFLPPQQSNSETGADLKDAERGSGLFSLLEFMYNGTVAVPENRLDELLLVARQLDFKMLVDAVEATKRGSAVAWQNNQRRRKTAGKTKQNDGEGGRDLPRRRRSSRKQSKGDSSWSDSSTSGSASFVSSSELSSESEESCGPDEVRLPQSKANIRPVSTDQRKAVEPKKAKKSDSIGSPDDRRPEIVRETARLALKTAPTRTALATPKGGKPAGKTSKSTGQRSSGDAAYQRSLRARQPLRKCPHCDWQTKSWTQYRIHLSKHDPARYPLFRCDSCGQKFFEAESLAHHRQQRHAGGPQVFRCSQCPFSAPKLQSLRSHKGYWHRLPGRERKKTVKCERCDYVCVSQGLLKFHEVMRHSSGDKPFKCLECSYETVRSTDLAKHVRVIHRGIRLFVCEVCGLKCGHQGALKQHFRTHTGEKPFACGLCDKRYRHSSQLKEHENWHADAPKPHVCEHCAHGFRRRDHLRAHLRTVHKIALEPTTGRRSVAAAVNSVEEIPI